jgi:hypothetical protein
VGLFGRAQRWRVGALALTAGTLVPLVLLLIADSLPFVLVAVFCLFFGSLIVRLVYVKIPHAASGH